MLHEEIKPYLEGSGLVGLIPNPENKYRTVDNGVLFASQVLLLLVEIEGPIYPLTRRMLGLPPLPSEIQARLIRAIQACIIGDYLRRSPGDETFDMPDDYYGAMSAALRVGLPLPYLKQSPGTVQPGLWYMHYLLKGVPYARLYSPFMALTIAFSNVFEDKDWVSNRMLTWTIIKGLQKKSFLCKIGGMVWLWRMKRQYGSIRRIAEIYFGPEHPIARYMVEN